MKTLTIILALITTNPDYTTDTCDNVESEKEIDFEGLYG